MSTTEGFGLVYYDRTTWGTDTIRLLIPNPKVLLAQKEQPKDESFFLEIEKPKPPVIQAETKTETQSSVKQEEKVQEEKVQAAQKQPQEHIAPSAKLPVPLAPNDCGELAAEKDFFRLRKAMAGKSTDDGMLEEARKAFKKQCFTTEQVRHLSALFLTAAGKYQFFDAAFTAVSDRSQFPTLQAEISDPYYLNRFQALIGK